MNHKDDIQLDIDRGPDPSKAKRKRRIIVWSLIAVMIVAGAAIVIVMLSNNAASKKQALYNKAVGMAMQGNWKDAIDTFESLSREDYKGARDFYLYCKGRKLYEEGDLKAAYKTLGETKLKDLTAEQRELIRNYFFELDHEYHLRYGYDLPDKPGSNDSPSSSGTGNSSHSSGNGSPATTDPYHANDYANEEDFYEDYYNDFIDFDEAEQYWEEYGE